MGAVRGEYWIQDGCSSTFADGDTGEYNHEMIAFSSALGLDDEEYGQLANANGFDWDGLAEKFLEDKDVDIDTVKSMTPEEWAAFCVEHGVDEKIITAYAEKPDDLEVGLGYQQMIDAGASREFIDWWEMSKAPDAREYAVMEMGWIRVKGDNYEMKEFDDTALECIKGFDGLNEILEVDENAFEEGGEYEDAEAYIEERSTGKTWSIPYRNILKAQSAKGLIRYMEGIGKYR